MLPHIDILQRDLYNLSIYQYFSRRCQMARKKNFEKQIDELNEQIEKTQEKLNSLLGMKKELEEKIRLQNIDQLYEMILKSGKSVDEIADIISQ